MKAFLMGIIALMAASAACAGTGGSSYTVKSFEWTDKEGCVAVGAGGHREAITGVTKPQCDAVTHLKDITVEYTHAENGMGYLAHLTSQQVPKWTCWYDKDGKPLACQDWQSQ